GNGRVADIGADLSELDGTHPGALRVARLDQRSMPIVDSNRARRQVQFAGIRQGGERVREGGQDEEEDQAAGDGRHLQPSSVAGRQPFGEAPAWETPARRFGGRGALAGAPTLPAPRGGGGFKIGPSHSGGWGCGPPSPGFGYAWISHWC